MPRRRPPSTNNIALSVDSRQRRSARVNPAGFVQRQYVSGNMINRLGLETELVGHTGCVNCLQWNTDGSLLASGSDDYNVILWNACGGKKKHQFHTGHTNNVFAVQFLPGTRDRVVISAAGDTKCIVHDLDRTSASSSAESGGTVYDCHVQRVKRLAVTPAQPHLFWSGSEDGLVMQYDVREPVPTCTDTCTHALLNLNALTGPHTEVKCIALSPTRPEQLAIGCNDPFLRVFDRRMLRRLHVSIAGHAGANQSSVEFNLLTLCMTRDECYDLPESCAQYYAASHLPIRTRDLRRNHRRLTITYLTFSPDGTELLANLGGEQVYLYDVQRNRANAALNLRQFCSQLRHVQKAEKHVHNGATNGHPNNGATNGHPNNGATNGHPNNGNWNGASNGHTYGAADVLSHVICSLNTQQHCGTEISPRAELLKRQANQAFESGQYPTAVRLYNDAILVDAHVASLYANRAAAYMKRAWDGDVYAALRDCVTALSHDPHHVKAHFRLARCLFDLQQVRPAQSVVELFAAQFPQHTQSQAYCVLVNDIAKAMETTREEGSDSDSDAEAKQARRARVDSLDNLSMSSYEADNDESMEEGRSEQSMWEQRLRWLRWGLKIPWERTKQRQALDYTRRFCGHCNTTTDIKEANFFGPNGQYIVAGSDDGSFYVWDRRSANIVRILKGDDSIVNCLQPHPTSCMLATSGIDPVVRLWTPQAANIADDRVVADHTSAADANQRRMNTDPLEVMLYNLGYRLSSNDAQIGTAMFGGAAAFDVDDETGDGRRTVTCSQQ